MAGREKSYLWQTCLRRSLWGGPRGVHTPSARSLVSSAGDRPRYGVSGAGCSIAHHAEKAAAQRTGQGYGNLAVAVGEFANAARQEFLNVRNQRRQIQISPDAQAKTRATGAQPRHAEGTSKERVGAGAFDVRREKSFQMTTSLVSLLPSKPGAGPGRKKRVLLVDASTVRRELRAEAFRKLGMDVDCAADIVEARAWWRADLYSLVLMDVDGESVRRDKFCADLRSATPPQQLAFLVGKPGYLSDAPNLNGSALSVDEEKPRGAPAVVSKSLPATEGPAQAWGIMEASRRISAVRSLAYARTQALRDRPTPPRDLESRHSKRVEA